MKSSRPSIHGNEAILRTIGNKTIRTRHLTHLLIISAHQSIKVSIYLSSYLGTPLTWYQIRFNALLPISSRRSQSQIPDHSNRVINLSLKIGLPRRALIQCQVILGVGCRLLPEALFLPTSRGAPEISTFCIMQGLSA